MKKITIVSLVLKWAFAVFALFYAGFSAFLFWAHAYKPEILTTWHKESGRAFFQLSLYMGEQFYTVPAAYKACHYLAAGLHDLVNVVILLYLAALFQRFSQGKIFAPQTIKVIKNISFLVLANIIYYPVAQAISSVALTWHNPVGERVLSVSASHMDFAMLLGAAVVCVIAWIMDEGRKLQDDMKLTI